ncbi:hypothetical protein QQS21_000915 [Conoideocrella luteorostrata]|uniref:Uncharacterized protein n=1 Tax=Conoideocrella luteorostrata TaxID=1105319 RepID=A0AAJ0CY37_9HYPO|nr:hypothetical protein QQS21_000915 [Conoideocrella luteorostrata]
MRVLPERIHLQIHILKLVVEPNFKQYKDITDYGLNVNRLERITNVALTQFLTRTDTNGAKRSHLQEIFELARQEERFKDNEIGGTTELYAKTDDQIPERDVADIQEAISSNDSDDLYMPYDEANIQQIQCHSVQASSHATTAFYDQELSQSEWLGLGRLPGALGEPTWLRRSF